jgi:hypothetical protein
MSKARDIADLDFNSPDIDGGNIDGATIGATTPAAGSFSSLSTTGSTNSGQVTVTQTHPTLFLQESGGGTTNAAYLQKFSNDLYLYNKESNGSLFLGTNNGTKLTINHVGNATFNGTISSKAITITDGTTNGASTIGSASDNLLLDTSGDTGITIRSGASSTGVVSFASPSDHNVGQVFYDHNNDSMVVRTNDATGLTIDSSQNATFGGNIEFSAITTHASMDNVSISVPDRQSSLYNVGDRGNITIQASSSTSGSQALSGGRVLINAGNSHNGQTGDVIISTGVNILSSSDKGKIRFNIGGRTSSQEVARITGDGLLFNGDTAQANALTDYEEGYWHPYISDGSTSVSLGSTTGYYTKIGRAVVLGMNGYNKNISSLSANGHLRITGLPFVPNLPLYCNAMMAQRNPVVSGISENGNTTMLLYKGDNNAVDYGLFTRNIWNGTSTMTFRFECTYQTNA